jgi:four helix bundle protein
LVRSRRIRWCVALSVARTWGMQEFKKLLVWRRAHAFGLRVHLVVETFPRRGFAELKSQLTGAGDSIATNIVEGCGAMSQREFARFLGISIKSASEAEHHLLCAYHRRALSRERHDPLCDDVTRIRKMLFALRKKVLAKPDAPALPAHPAPPESAENLSRQSVTHNPQPTTQNQQRQSRDTPKL